MDTATQLLAYFGGLIWVVIPLMLIIFVGGLVVLLLNRNPDLLKQHPEKARLFRKRAGYITPETKKGRFDVSGGLRFFKLKNVKHLPITDVQPEFKDPDGYYNFLEIRKGVIVPIILGTKTGNHICPVVTPKLKESVDANGNKMLEIVTEKVKDLDGKEIEVVVYEQTGKFTNYPLQVDVTMPLIDDNTYLMLNMIANELPKNKEVMTQPNVIERNKEIIMFVTAAALSVLLLVVVIQQGLIPTVDKITALSTEVAKSNIEVSKNLVNITKNMVCRGNSAP